MTTLGVSSLAWGGVPRAPHFFGVASRFMCLAVSGGCCAEPARHTKGR
jgi:hypothetical protein